MESLDLTKKQYAILNYLVNIMGLNIPKINLFTFNLKEVYNLTDETWKIFCGLLPAKECIDLSKLHTITHFGYFKNILNYEDLTPDFLACIKKDYESLINLYYEIIFTPDLIEKRFDDLSHNGTKNTVRSTKNGDIDFFLIKGVNLKTDLNDSEIEELCELFNHYDSLWDKKSGFKIKIESKKQYYKTKLSEKPDSLKKQIDLLDKELQALVEEEKTKIWSKIEEPSFYWDSLYKLDIDMAVGIEDNLGSLTEKNKYINGNKIIEKRKEQLEKLKLILKSGQKCNGIDEEFIDNELKKINLNTDIEIKDKVINICNNSQWSKNEENLSLMQKIEGNKKDILNSLPFLYQFIDYNNKDNPCDFLPLNLRQYIFGYSSEIKKLNTYKQYFRILGATNPNVRTPECYFNLVAYSVFFNKFMTLCANETNMLFPLRFIINNPLREDNTRILNRLSNSPKPIQFIKYKLIGIIRIKRKWSKYPDKDYNLYNFIFKNTDSIKSEFHWLNGKFSHFAFIDHSRFLQVHHGNIYHLKGITWDEFSMTYEYLNNDLYVYKKDIEENSKNLNIFVHNKRFQPIIEDELQKQLVIFDKNLYDKFTIPFKKFNDNIDPTQLLNSKYLEDIFKIAQPRNTQRRKYNFKLNSILQNLDRPVLPPAPPILKSINIENNNYQIGYRKYLQDGGSKIFQPQYISNYKFKLLFLNNKLLDFKNNKISFTNREIFSLLKIYSYLHKNNNINYFNINLEYSNHYEFINYYNLIYKDNMNILEINNFNNESIISCKYIAQKKNILINCDTHLFIIYKKNIYGNKLSEIINSKILNESNNIFINKNYITKNNLLNNIFQKYDLIFCNITNFFKEFNFYQEESSINLKFIFIIYSLLRLKKNGTLCIHYGDISTIQSYQIINNLIPYFENINIYNIEINPKWKQSGTVIICKKFKDNFIFKKYENIIDTIFNLDKTLGNEFNNINIQNTTINIYLDNYAINKHFNEKLLNDIKSINLKKNFFINKEFFEIIDLFNKFKNSNTILDDIVKYYDDLRLVCSYMKGKELDLIDNKDDTPELKKHVKETIKKLKENKVVIKNIAIYKKLSQVTNTATINLEKLKVIQEFYHIINDNKKEKKSNIFDLINFDTYKLSIYSLLEKNKDLYISYNTDDLYNFEFIHKKDDNYVLTTENKNFIENILISYFNEVIDTLYEKQNINYYLDMYKL